MKNASVYFWSILFVYLFMGLPHAEVYRWLNDDGELIYGDKPPEGSRADAVPIENRAAQGMKFATPEQVEQFHTDAQTRKKTEPAPGNSNLSKSYCRRYRSDLNKIEIYLQHTYSVRDAQKASDLRKIIKRECSDINLSAEDNRSRCRSYHEEIVKTEIYLEHTPNPRDKQKVKDLRKQIARECE